MEITNSKTQIEQKIKGENHINNMVGVDDTLNTSQPNGGVVLEAIKNLGKKSRILLDLFAVSINPKTVKNGWKIEKDELGKLIWKPKGRLTNLLPDEFFAHFLGVFSEIIELDDEYIDIGGGEGFNAGRKYTNKDTNGTIQFRYFDPSKSAPDIVYVSGSAEKNYFRQKINMKLTGDGLQELRHRGILVQFLKELYTQYECDVTMFDATCDMFNYHLVPKDFADLYEKNQYVGKSNVNVMGNVLNPTVYIGSFKGARTIMLYDKLQEANDKSKSDEPELVEILKQTGGNWFRLEQHFSRDQKEAAQAFDYLMSDVLNVKTTSNIDDIFNQKLSMLLKQQVSTKCRFLAQRKKADQNQRIKTHKKWQLILDILGETMSDFAFERPVLTLEERKANFKYRSLGGMNLFVDIIEMQGKDMLDEFLKEVADYANEKFIKAVEQQ